MGRKAVICKHGNTRSTSCPLCRKEWNSISYQKYREARLRGEVEPVSRSVEFPYAITGTIRKKFRRFYWNKSIITKAVLEDRTRNPQCYFRSVGEYFSLQDLPNF